MQVHAAAGFDLDAVNKYAQHYLFHFLKNLKLPEGTYKLEVDDGEKSPRLLANHDLRMPVYAVRISREPGENEALQYRRVTKCADPYEAQYKTPASLSMTGEIILLDGDEERALQKAFNDAHEATMKEIEPPAQLYHVRKTDMPLKPAGSAVGRLEGQRGAVSKIPEKA